MSVFQAFILGLVQGLTEFLPVSSSGHLVVAREYLGIETIPVLFDVLLHVATLLVVVIVFRRRIGLILGALWRVFKRAPVEGDRLNLRLIPPLFIATVLTAGVGFGVSRFEEYFTGRLTSLLFLVTAGVLLLTLLSKPKRSYEVIGLREALWTGIGQGLGVFPGISRSGITIASGLFAGMKREEAGEFAFLLSIPAILGALLLKWGERAEMMEMIPASSLIAGFVASFAVGMAALIFLLRLIRKGKLHLFAIYLIPAAIFGLLFL
ncbi:MAG: undecaprenyl-diphosphate phosphatase [Spirochaetales bacterium]|nr:undecaprenyl-diphosphate phosphatase [Spirochaetales bacterium]MCF7939067.1 undecaprenyl-diphosphate phosphatase [Spirochaetales bacterium]